MADYYSIATAKNTVACSEDKCKHLTQLLEAEVLDEDGEKLFHGFSLNYRNGKIYLVTDGDDSAQPDYLPRQSCRTQNTVTSQRRSEA
jgi:hypothetical protein